MDAPTPTIQPLATRVERLEKQNRWLKRTLLALVALPVALVVMGQIRPTSRTITAQHFVLLDSSGHKRAELGIFPLSDPDFGSGPALRLFDSKGEQTTFLAGGALLLEGPAETVSIATGDTSSKIEMFNPDNMDGDGHVQLTSGANGVALMVQDSKGFNTVIGSSDLVTTSTGERHHTSAASIDMFNKAGKVIWAAP